eukprot:6183574-Pleurochrysis_carterae.AAC.2
MCACICGCQGKRMHAHAHIFASVRGYAWLCMFMCVCVPRRPYVSWGRVTSRMALMPPCSRTTTETSFESNLCRLSSSESAALSTVGVDSGGFSAVTSAWIAPTEQSIEHDASVLDIIASDSHATARVSGVSVALVTVATRAAASSLLLELCMRSSQQLLIIRITVG